LLALEHLRDLLVLQSHLREAVFAQTLRASLLACT
jgi:hypothetical protein